VTAGRARPWGALLLLAIGCAGATPPPEAASKEKKDDAEPWPELGERQPRRPEAVVEPPIGAAEKTVAIVGATVLTAAGPRIADGVVVLKGSKIAAIGRAADVPIPEGAEVVDARGKFVTPGLIDTHSHLGVYATPHIDATADGNEMTDPTTPYVFSEHAFWPQDPGLERAAAGGVTALQILPGSGNVIGGRAFTIRNLPRRSARAMRFPGAPFGLKMACGENPKRVYGGTGRQPMSRMGNLFKLREAFLKAQAYRFAEREHAEELRRWKDKRAKAATDEDEKDPGKPPGRPDRDLGKETLAEVLDGRILVHVHCYRADEMLQILAMGEELGFEVRSFHHAVEAYKIADVLAQKGVAASMWADWWGFKLEAYDGIEENIAAVHAAGGRAIVHSDSGIGIQRLNQEAAKALHSGRRAGLKIEEDEAIRWVTINPAWALGIDEQTGTLEVGKEADVVLWDASPLSIYARAERTWVGGRLVHDAGAPPAAWSDFEVGTELEEVRP
jgi:imidazolonepropionase-like amidohydrolase